MLALLLALTQATCGDPQAVDRLLDAKLLALKVGTILPDTQPSGDDGISVFPVEDARHVAVHLFVRSGQRTATMTLTCTRDDDQRIAGCSIQDARKHMVVISREQFERLKPGRPIGGVMAELCAPETVVVRSDGEFRLTYTLDISQEAYLPFTPVSVQFDKSGRLVRKIEGT